MRSENKLTNLQLELLTRYFAGRSISEMEKMWAKESRNNETMEKWLNGHNRLSAKK